MDFSTLPLGADLSHYQARPDFGRLVADGVQYVILKATQGTTADPDFDWNRNEAARRGLLWLPYPYLTPADTGKTIQHFLSVVGASVPVALDWEKAGTPAALVEAWIDTCEEKTGKPGLAYYGLYPPAPITERISRWPHWLPEYPRDPDEGPRLPPWDGASDVADWSVTWLIWQFTGTGRLPGIAPAIDLNRLACPIETFRRWYESGILPVSGPASLLPIVTDRLLRRHCSGADVLMLQRHLVASGFSVSLDADYGPQTAAAIMSFQTGAGLASDGIAGPATIAALNAAKGAPNAPH